MSADAIVNSPRSQTPMMPMPSRARRPGSGEIAAYDFDKVVGKRLTRAVTRNTQLKWGDLG